MNPVRRRLSRGAVRSVPLVATTILTGACLADGASWTGETVGSVQSATITFVHPGVDVDGPTLDFVKQRIAAGIDPWKTAYDVLVADSHAQLTYAATPPSGSVQCGSYSSPDVHCHDQRNDALAAYSLALVGFFKSDPAYSQHAMQILDKWVTGSTAITKIDSAYSNAPVQASWVGGLYARAAELLRYSDPTDWNSGSYINVTNFNNVLMSSTGVVRVLLDNTTLTDGKNGNWEMTSADSMIAIGAYLEDSTEFNNGITRWNARVPNYFYMTTDGTHPQVPANGYSGTGSGYCASGGASTCDAYGYWGQAKRTLADGTCQETCRDFEHAQLGLAAAIHGAETARIQGTNLFSQNKARLVAAMNFMAKYINQGGPDDLSGTLTLSGDTTCGGTINMLSSVGTGPNPFPAAWETAYNEFHEREGVPVTSCSGSLCLDQVKTLITNNQLLVPNNGSLQSSFLTYDATRVLAWESLTQGIVPTCTPLTSCPAPLNCGTISDGCGGTLNCGTCSGTNTCGGTGQTNVCGTPNTCTPATCGSNNCGAMPDGCGGTVTCPACTSSQVCATQGSQANTCIADTTPPTNPTEFVHGGASSTGVNVVWNPSTDNVEVASYDLYKSNSHTTNVPPASPWQLYAGGITTTSYTIPNGQLSQKTPYYFALIARDAAGNSSAPSDTIGLTTDAFCSTVVTSNTFTSPTTTVSYTNVGASSEANPTFTMTVPSSAVVSSCTGALTSNHTITGCTSGHVVCTQQGQDINLTCGCSTGSDCGTGGVCSSSTHLCTTGSSLSEASQGNFTVTYKFTSGGKKARHFGVKAATCD
jgi:hypothetical protein